MIMEVALVFDKEGNTIAWHLPPGRTQSRIPDTRSLWDLLWENRHRLGGVAHTHPWNGSAWFSEEDRSTFYALERGLGQKLLWPVVTFSEIGYYVAGALAGEYVPVDPKLITIAETLDIEELRAKSRA